MGARPAVLVLLLAAVAGCGGGERRPDAAPSRPAAAAGQAGSVERVRGVRYTLPAGWRAASRSLTPHLADPRELLTAGTGPLPAGGACAHVPANALQAMRPADVLVTVQERHGGFGAFPPRRRSFVLPAPEHTDAEECAGPRRTFTTRWFEFRDAGRGFHVLVAVGRDASARRVREAVALLDSLRVSRRG